MKAKIKKEAWGDKGSYIKKDMCSNGKVKYIGIYVYNFCKFFFSIVAQNNSKYKYRGYIIATDEFGETIMKNSKKIKANIYIYDGDEVEIKNAVAEKAVNLFSNHAKDILRNLEKSYRPDTITPVLAATFKAREYAEFKHQGCKKTVIDRVERTVKRTCGILPMKPMNEIAKSEIKSYLELHGVGRSAVNELYYFWQYAIDNGICIRHANPVGKITKKQAKGKKKIEALLKKMQLDLEAIDLVFDELERINSGAAMGSALLFSAVPSKVVEQLRWKDIKFPHKEKDDFVVVAMYLPTRKGATHDFSRPLLPRSAELLYKKYKELISIHGEEAVKNFPVVAQKRDPAKKLKLDQVYALIEQLIIKVEIIESADIAMIKKLDLQTSSARRICVRTYCSLLKHRCNLDEDNMIYKFLCGLALGNDTTLDNYTGMCSLPGWELMYTSMAPLRKKTKKDKNDVHEEQRSVIWPETNRELVKVASTIVISPGQEIIIKCKHGVTGTAKAKLVKH